MGFTVDLPTFAGGEISPTVAARYDTAKYRTALARSRNCLGAAEGGAYMRPGFSFAGRVKNIDRKARVIPFQFSIEQGYAIELGHQSLRILYQGGYIIRPKLTISSIAREPNAAVGCTAHGYTVGWDVYFSDVAGMTQINGQIARVTAIIDANNFRIGIDTTSYSAFTSDSGGVAGNSLGGVGGYAPPPATPVPPPFEDVEPAPIVIDPGDYTFGGLP